MQRLTLPATSKWLNSEKMAWVFFPFKRNLFTGCRLKDWMPKENLLVSARVFMRIPLMGKSTTSTESPFLLISMSISPRSIINHQTIEIKYHSLETQLIGIVVNGYESFNVENSF